VVSGAATASAAVLGSGTGSEPPPAAKRPKTAKLDNLALANMVVD